MLNASSQSSASSGYCSTAPPKGAVENMRNKKSFQEGYFPSFHCLPPEIITEIFILCLPDVDDVFKSQKAVPLVLCNVSSLWRSLALSIPRLWNELSIRIANPQVDIDFAVAMAESWIARSGGLPLSLHLHANPGPYTAIEQTTAMFKAHLRTFLCYASRWESVDIDFKNSHEISLPEFGPTPLLRKFSYSVSCHNWYGIPCPFTSCPLLSAFSWPSSCSPALDPEIPWHQLTHIVVEKDMTIHQTLDILRTCKTLVEFKVGIGCDIDFEQVRRPVENRSLRRFHIRVYITCADLLQSLTLPALTDFSLNTNFESLSDDRISTRSIYTELLRLFTRSGCNLEKFELENCGFNDDDILKCLQHDSCSSLTELKVSNDEDRPMFTDRVILALTIEDELSEVNNVLLPKLSCLSLNLCGSASPGFLGAMVLRRRLWCDEDHQLKSLTLFVRDLDDMDCRCLELARGVGLDVDRNYTESEFTHLHYTNTIPQMIASVA